LTLPRDQSSAFHSARTIMQALANLAAEVAKPVPGVDPRPAQKAQLFAGLNAGPAETASRLCGLVNPGHDQAGHVKDSAPYYTSSQCFVQYSRMCLTSRRLRPAPAFADPCPERRRNPSHVRLLLAREAAEFRPQQDLRAVRDVAIGLSLLKAH
jgi:hypothetical protein